MRSAPTLGTKWHQANEVIDVECAVTGVGGLALTGGRAWTDVIEISCDGADASRNPWHSTSYLASGAGEIAYHISFGAGEQSGILEE